MASHDLGERAFRATFATQLLRDALRELAPDAVARVTGVSVVRLHRWSDGSADMAFVNRIRVTMALITLAPPGSDLFRRAARLRLQLAASLEFDTGVTRATASPPRLHL